MHLTTPFLAGALALGASSLLSACSGGSSGSPPVQGGQTTLQPLTFAAGGASISGHLSKHSPAVERRERTMGRWLPAHRHPTPGNLYLSSVANIVTVLSNGTFGPNGDITDGIRTPDGEWSDANKNLYVTNYYPNNNVVEYACTVSGCGSSPTFTYNSGLSNAVNVTTDRSGNVYVTSYGGSSAGQVVEYAQGSNTVTQSCSVPAVAGVAVDSSTGDVYVAHGGSGIDGYIEKFSGGLAGCNGTPMSVTFGSPGDVILDNHKNIIVCDQWNGAVDVISPPYTSITKTIGSGWIDPYQPALEKRGKKNLLYIDDSGGGGGGYGLIGVYDYPSGKHVATISGSNSGPFKNLYGLTDTFNYVP
jgi:hypothetical protein